MYCRELLRHMHGLFGVSFGTLRNGVSELQGRTCGVPRRGLIPHNIQPGSTPYARPYLKAIRFIYWPGTLVLFVCLVKATRSDWWHPHRRKARTFAGGLQPIVWVSNFIRTLYHNSRYKSLDGVRYKTYHKPYVPVHSMIDAWPDLTAFAVDIGVSYNTAKQMRRRTTCIPTTGGR